LRHLARALREILASDGNCPLDEADAGDAARVGNGAGRVGDERHRGDIRVLVAEDNPVNRVVARSMIEKLGFRVDVVEDGRQAVDAVGKDSYDIVFMDCQMPVMDGYEATQAIRSLEGDERHTSIVAMTAHAVQGDRDVCLEAGMDDYIPKPVKLIVLEEIFARWVRGVTEKTTI
jgi:CheY-like chemotaxis protein